MCHMKASGTYVPIEVSGSAMAAHQAHYGDWMPEDGSCSSSDPPTTDPPPVTLSCGAPTGAINPGSTSYPGPTVDTIAGGVSLEFAVAANPIPTSSTWIDREVLDEYVTGPVPPTTTPILLKADGTYDGSSWTSGSISFVRQIRFILDDAASCFGTLIRRRNLDERQQPSRPPLAELKARVARALAMPRALCRAFLCRTVDPLTAWV